MVNLYDYQKDAIRNMKNGCILCGGVGSGKSRTALAYFCGLKNPVDLYIITTARKRDTMEWEGELIPFHMSTKKELNLYNDSVIVDSWNNISKYADVKGTFFIFDEQRVVGSGAWVKAFLKIAKANQWILLSATPGDSWSDYIPVFIANGFYKNKTEFAREHIVYRQFAKFPQIDRYLNTGRLLRLRSNILVNMNFHRETISHNESIYTEYPIETYKYVMKNRWDIYNDEPFETASGLCYCLRKIVNTDQSRLKAVKDIIYNKKKVIVFYNFDYELDMLKGLSEQFDELSVAEWNGHKHQDIPHTDNWIYLVQYNAGAEGWNCILTDTIIFFSQNYSYKIMIQSSGRIDRLNTPFKDLYFYHLKSHSSIDIAIDKALHNKKKFNETKFAG